MVDRQTARSRALHRATAEKLLAHPGPALAAARRRLSRLTAEAPHARYYVQEWTRWLDGPLADVYRLLAEDGSEYAEALRRMSPFVGLLSPQERWAVYRQYRPDGWTRHAP